METPLIFEPGIQTEAGIVWAPEDVLRLYQLVLDRGVESRDILEEMAGWEARHRIGSFFHSPEFKDTVGARLLAGERPRDSLAPNAELTVWAARMMPLSDRGRERVASVRSWSALYHALASDEVFRGYLDPDSPLTEPKAFATLTAAAQVEGRLEEAAARYVRGWAVSPDAPDAALAVEVWINGAFCSAGVTERFRRDIQDAFGGGGRAGFEIEIPAAAGVRFPRMEIEVRAATSQFVLGRATVASQPPGPDILSDVRNDMAEARRLLARLEDRLPGLENALSVPLSDYDGYSRAWRESGPEPEPCDLGIDVVLDIGAGAFRDVELSARAVSAQTHGAKSLILVANAERLALAGDLCRRLDWTAPGMPTFCVASEERNPVVRFEVGLAAAGGEAVLGLTPDVVLERYALARIARRFADDSSLEAVYFDEDVFDPQDLDADPDARRRTAPRLKPEFDPDYLLQTPYVGELVAWRRSRLETSSLRPEAVPHAACEALLRLQPDQIGHIGRVLASRTAPEQWDAGVWRDQATLRVAETGLAAAVEPRADILGAPVEALRIRRKPPAASACVIIPTRDGLDMLQPCIDSLLDRRGDNLTPFEILIIDHQSREPAVHDYLSTLAAQGLARILPYEGAFNWALMNNLAAAETGAEVLVFLNNDTLALSRDWLDELTAQALRPEIGPVGCRLIYGDGTIQHAGFVNRETASTFLSHEGVGSDGGDPGYLGRYALTHATAAVTGACMAVRAELFRRLGGFDPAFPVEGNDVDLCLRARAEGLTVLYTPDATFYHLESKTRGFNHDLERQAVAEAASRIIWRRWGERFSRDPGFNAHFDRMSRPFARLRPPPPWAG